MRLVRPVLSATASKTAENSVNYDLANFHFTLFYMFESGGGIWDSLPTTQVEVVDFQTEFLQFLNSLFSI